MNAKKLIIAFVTVSVAALIVSAFAVFTVARTYSRSLSTEAETAPPPPETTSEPEETQALPTVNDHPETDGTEAAGEETAAAPETTCPEETTAAPRLFTLTLSDGRLIITSPEGERVYERMIDEGGIRSGDRKLLAEGIGFKDLDGAMSAVYDLIS